MLGEVTWPHGGVMSWEEIVTFSIEIVNSLAALIADPTIGTVTIFLIPDLHAVLFAESDSDLSVKAFMESKRNALGGVNAPGNANIIETGEF